MIPPCRPSAIWPAREGEGRPCILSIADELAARTGRIDILLNNAGIARSETPAEIVAEEHWLNVLNVNLNS